MEKRNISFPPKDHALRDDVRMLGAMVGDVLIEQCGQSLFELVEKIRICSIARREDDSANLDPVADLVADAGPEISHQLVRAFSVYFQVANLAERVHRIRRIRDYQRDGEFVSGSLREILAAQRAAGITEQALQTLLENLVIEPVMTAHPTEATRRTLLEKERAIVKRLVERLDSGRTPDEEHTALERIRQQITAGWQTRSYAAVRPTVAAEREHVLFYLAEVLYQVVPVFYESLRRALDDYFPAVFAKAPLPRILRFGSWVGGDMDGNPNVDERTISESLAEHRRLVVSRYIPEARHLARELSQSLSEVEISDAVIARINAYREQLPKVAAMIPQRYADMPYRTLLTLIAARLEMVLGNEPFQYQSGDELLEDLRTIRESLEQNRGLRAGLFQVNRFIWRVRTFGFHLATLDVRQDAMELRAAVGELAGIDGWTALDSKQRTAKLLEMLAEPPPEAAKKGPQSSRALAVLETVRECRKTYGPDSIGGFIISMAQGADDVLSVMWLARIAGLAGDGGALPIDIAPLLETVADLKAGDAIIRELAACPPYREHLSGRENRQLIMIGYSDSNKDSGIAAARWALHQTQRQLTKTAAELGLNIGFFHGRGGTISRGGGNMVHGIHAAPGGSVNGFLRVTEQGEVIHQKYGIRPLALRNLEQISGATIAASLRTPVEAGRRRAQIMDVIARTAREAYRALVYENDRFEPYFRQATPIDVIERLAIGSRPSARRTRQGIDNLRAIPWVFSWSQTRIGLPGTFGVGAGLEAAINEFGLESLQDMIAWPFFGSFINDVEMVLAKSDLEIGRRYSELADPELRGIFDIVAAESLLSESLILKIKGTDHLLSSDETLRRAIRLRNPYVDPLNLLQIKLLRQWRSDDRQDDALLQTLFETVNGIARGIQNTG